MSPLFPHQQAVVDAVLPHLPGGWALLPEQRVGKSRIAVELARRMEARRVLVLCPSQAGNVPKVWLDEAAAQWPGMRLTNLTGTGRERAETLKRLDGQPGIVICNYESAWRSPLGPTFGRRGMTALGALAGQQWDVLICDEVHRLKHATGAHHRMAVVIADRTPVRLGLTGTPMHSPLDIWGQMRILVPAAFGTSYVSFRLRYTRPAEKRELRDKDLTWTRDRGGALHPWKYRDLDDLHERLARYSTRILLRDAFPDMPPELPDEVRTVELEPAARKVYREMARDFVAGVEGGTVVAANAGVKVLRLQQLCGGTLRDATGVEHRISTAKESLLHEMLIDFGDEPLVIFGRFHSDLDAIHRACKAAGVTSSELSGRRSELAEWQAGETQVLVAQIQSGGVGIDLTRANTVVYYSPGTSLIDHMQSRSRILGPKQTKPASYVYLVVTGTADGGDEAVYASLAARQDVVRSIIGRLATAAPSASHPRRRAAAQSTPTRGRTPRSPSCDTGASR